MTAEEKTALMDFLDLAADYLKDGHSGYHEIISFENDAPCETAAEINSPAGLASNSLKEKPDLPLAYTVEEPSDSGEYGGEFYTESGETKNSLDETLREIAACKACGLSAARTFTVPGEGVFRPLVMVIGEGPGADEDAAGKPFIGRAGQLLDKMLSSIDLSRNKNCYIANMVKCRPPGNRDPAPEEIAACFPFLERQISLLQPRIILCAGRVAAQNLLKTGRGINSLRGEFAEFRYSLPDGGTKQSVPVLCTFHPSAVLRDETLKRPAWEDLKLLRTKIETLDRDAALGNPDDAAAPDIGSTPLPSRTMPGGTHA